MPSLIRIRAFRVFVAVGLGGAVVLFTPRTVEAQVVLCALAAAFPFVLALVRRRFDPFEPVYLFATSFMVMFVLRPIFELREGLQPWLGYVVTSTYPTALWVATIGAIAFYFGYYMSAGKKIASRVGCSRQPWRLPDLWVVVTVAVVVAVFLFGIFIATSGGWPLLIQLLRGRSSMTSTALQESSGYFYTGPQLLVPFGLLVLGLSPRWASRQGLLGFCLLALSQIFTIGLGNRSLVLPVVASVFLLWYLRQGRRPSLRTLGLIALLVFIFGITLPRQYRNVVVQHLSVTATLASAITDPAHGVDEFFRGADTAMVDDLAIELQFVPSRIHYRMGATYLEALSRPIPRGLWPSKPVEAERSLMQVIWPVFERARVGFAFSVFGEPYLNGGLVGVILFSVIFGLAWRFVYEWFERHPTNVAAAVVFAVTWPLMFVYLRGGGSGDYQQLLINVVPIAVAVAIAQWPRSNARSNIVAPAEFTLGTTAAMQARPV